MHHMRAWRALQPKTPVVLTTGETSYREAHHRIARRQGKARDQRCVGCAGQAVHWSYNGGSEQEQTELDKNGNALRYSGNPDDYSPRCVTCHKFYDMRLAVLNERPL